MNKSSIKEEKIESYLRRRVAALGGVCEKVTVIGKRGFFDRVVVLPGGRVIFVECKRPSGSKISVHQILWRTTYRALGAEAVTIKSAEEVDSLLTAPKRQG